MSDWYFLVFGIISAVIGLILIALKIKVIASCRVKTVATISALHIEKTLVRGSTVRTYYPVLTYSYDNESYTCTAPFSSVRANKYKEGEQMIMYISSDNPELYRFPRRLGMIFTGLIFLSVGLLFVVLFFF